MDKHMPAGVKNSSTFSCFHLNPPRDPETGSSVGARVGVLEFPLQKQEPGAEAWGLCIFNGTMNYRAAWIPASSLFGSCFCSPLLCLHLPLPTFPPPHSAPSPCSMAYLLERQARLWDGVVLAGSPGWPPRL